MGINLPNGNEVEEIILPNGANAREVIGPNGERVFGGPAIPDSAVAHFPHSEGSGDTLNDEVGIFDGDIVGASWDDTESWHEGYALHYDGGRDRTELTKDVPIIDTDDDGFTYLMTVYWEGSGREYIYEQRMGGPRIDFSIESGQFRLRIGEDTTVQSFDVSADTLYRVAFVFDDSSQEGEIWVNGGFEASGSTSRSLSSTSDNNVHQFGARESTSDSFEGKLDNVIVTDEPLSHSEIEDDYDRQPWT